MESAILKRMCNESVGGGKSCVIIHQRMRMVMIENKGKTNMCNQVLQCKMNPKSVKKIIEGGVFHTHYKLLQE